MKPEYFDQLVRWYREERDSFKAKGATGEILQEAALHQLVLDILMTKHLAEIRSDPQFLAAILDIRIPGIDR
jgi:hypothetical protein